MSLESENLAQWTLADELVSLTVQGQSISVSAADIVRVECKGAKSLAGLSIPVRPSECLQGLKFNRFPPSVGIHLDLPVAGEGRPALRLGVDFGGKKKLLTSFDFRDQIICDNEWFPLPAEGLDDVRAALEESGIEGFGRISLRQALNLIRQEPQCLHVNEISRVDSEDSNQVVCDHEELGKRLRKLGFSATLYSYQMTGLSWLSGVASEGLGCILADEMGLGKTIQIIALLTYFNDQNVSPSLIIAPATLLENWRRELLKFSPEMQVLIQSGAMRTGFPSELEKYDVVITSYDTAVRDQGLLGMINWQFVVLDEAQAVKNPGTRRALAVKAIPRGVSIAVSGTPVENKLRDLWSLMDFSCPGLLGTQVQFEENYAEDEFHAKKLERVVSPLMLRRRVADVAADLPAKIIIPQAVNMSDEAITGYERLRNQIADEYGDAATFVSLIKLRQFCVHPFVLDGRIDGDPLLYSDKYRRLIEILEEIVGRDQKVVIFTSFIIMSDLLSKDLSNRFGISCDQIDGRTPVPDRQNVVDKFSAINGSAVLVLNPRAAGTGLNITAANHVIHYNLEWNPAVEDQATARAYRHGQTLPVTVHRLFYPGTIEEVIDDRLDRKRRLAEAAVIGTEGAGVDAADISRAITISPIARREE